MNARRARCLLSGLGVVAAAAALLAERLGQQPSRCPQTDGLALPRHDVVGFAGRAAHDLQGPLSVIEGWCRELSAAARDQSLSAVQLDAIAGRIDAAACEARAVVDALLEDAVARDRVAATERVDLTVLARDVVASRPGPGEIVVEDIGVARGDPVLLQRLFANLIDNAVKYVAPGTTPSVTISGGQVAGQIQVSVADLGIGIPAGQHERIFEAFERATTDYSGTGLGLSICRRIAERHGGRIRALDRDDHRVGAVFELTLPAWHPGDHTNEPIRVSIEKGAPDDE